MEPFRPLIADSVALMLINNGEIGGGHFLRRGPAVTLTTAGRKAVLAAFEFRTKLLGDGNTAHVAVQDHVDDALPAELAECKVDGSTTGFGGVPLAPVPGSDGPADLRFRPAFRAPGPDTPDPLTGRPALDREEAVAANLPVTDDGGHVSPGQRPVKHLAVKEPDGPLVGHALGPGLEVALRIDGSQYKSVGFDAHAGILRIARGPLCTSIHRAKNPSDTKVRPRPDNGLKPYGIFPMTAHTIADYTQALMVRCQ